MFFPGVAEVEIAQFDGAILKLEDYQVPLNKQLYAQNVAYIRGQIGTRFGHSTAFSLTDGAVTAMANWFFVILGVQVSVIAYYAPSVGVRTLNQSGPTLQTITATTGAAGAVMVPAAQRLYMAFYDATGRIGFTGGKIYGWSIGTDPLFAAPLTNVPSCAETGAGLCNAGTHRIGYLTTTRNGYTGTIQPISGTTFAPTSFTSTGGKNIQVTINGAIPSYLTGGSIQIVMSTVSNPNQYFTVPGATSLPFNPTIITISISDDDLAATGKDVTDRITLITQTTGGSDPFSPYGLWTYSNRMCYAGFTPDGFPVVYISEPNDFQFITADQHAIFLEGQQQCVQGFSLRGVCYIGCTSGFYACTDNGNVPSAWTPPQRVDGSIGILSVTCVYVNPSAGYALIASEPGFYLFQGGIFPALPLSYYQDADWNRINWNVATAVQISEDTAKKQFIVMAPLNNYVASVAGSGPYTITTTTSITDPGPGFPHLYQTGLAVKIAGVSGTPTITVTGPNTFTIAGGAGVPTVNGLIQPQAANAEMIWDYSDGDTAETAKYAINAFTAYRPASMAVIRTLASLQPEVYYGPAANGPMIRKNNGLETLPYRDVDMSGAAAAINAIGETALHPDPLQPGMTVHDYHGAHFQVRGNPGGAFNLTANGLNGVISVVPVASPLALQAKPKIEQLVRWFLRSERQSIRFGTNAVDDYFILSLIRSYYTDAFPIR